MSKQAIQTLLSNPRFISFWNLMDSTVEGEQLNAMRFVTKALKAEGLSFGDIIAFIKDEMHIVTADKNGSAMNGSIFAHAFNNSFSDVFGDIAAKRAASPAMNKPARKNKRMLFSKELPEMIYGTPKFTDMRGKGGIFSMEGENEIYDSFIMFGEDNIARLKEIAEEGTNVWLKIKQNDNPRFDAMANFVN